MAPARSSRILLANRLSLFLKTPQQAVQCTALRFHAAQVARAATPRRFHSTPQVQALLPIAPAVAISGPATVSIGTTTTFSASASDAETSASELWYQWGILDAYAGVDLSGDETASSINVVVPNYEVAMMPISLNLEVCDEGGYFAPPECTSATVVIEVIDANAFSVDAGSDVSAQPGDVVQLSGSVSGVTAGLAYHWWDNDNVMVSETTSYSFTVPADARSGDTFTFTFIADHSDDGRDSDDDILITVSRPIFTVNAGSDQTVASGDTVTLTGSAANALGAPTYEWSQTSGPSVTISAQTPLWRPSQRPRQRREPSLRSTCTRKVAPGNG